MDERSGVGECYEIKKRSDADARLFLKEKETTRSTPLRYRGTRQSNGGAGRILKKKNNEGQA